jgi:hypothetical protein
MRCNVDDRNPILLRSVIPEDPVGRRCGLLGVGLKDLFSLRSFEEETRCEQPGGDHRGASGGEIVNTERKNTQKAAVYTSR